MCNHKTWLHPPSFLYFQITDENNDFKTKQNEKSQSNTWWKSSSSLQVGFAPFSSGNHCFFFFMCLLRTMLFMWLVLFTCLWWNWNLINYKEAIIPQHLLSCQSVTAEQIQEQRFNFIILQTTERRMQSVSKTNLITNNNQLFDEHTL